MSKNISIKNVCLALYKNALWFKINDDQNKIYLC